MAEWTGDAENNRTERQADTTALFYGADHPAVEMLRNSVRGVVTPEQLAQDAKKVGGFVPMPPVEMLDLPPAS